MSSYFLKLALPVVGKSFTYLFDRSISQVKFPTTWKIARVTPIFKDGEQEYKRKLLCYFNFVYNIEDEIPRAKLVTIFN